MHTRLSFSLSILKREYCRQSIYRIYLVQRNLFAFNLLNCCLQNYKIINRAINL